MRYLRIVPALLLMGAAPMQRYTIDEAQSQVSAKVAFFSLASTTARFPKVSGGITLSPDAPQRIDLIVSIDATSLTAPDGITLARLKGPAFFDVAQHPTIIFRGNAMRLTSDDTAIVDGQITARGVTRPATLAVRFTAPPWGSGRRRSLVMDGETVIDRRDFGMTSYPVVVGRMVTISIRAMLNPA